MKSSLVLVSVGMLALAGCATTGTTNGSTQATVASNATPTESNATTTEGADKEDVDYGDRVICKRERVTGSRIAMRKVCMTGREWDAKLRRTQEGLQDMGRGGAGAPSPEMGGGD